MASSPAEDAAPREQVPTAPDLASVILGLLAEREPGVTICPSDAARRAYTGAGEGWRQLMQPVRDAAAQLVDEGVVEVTQGGSAVDVRTARGPVRIRRRQ